MKTGTNLPHNAKQLKWWHRKDYDKKILECEDDIWDTFKLESGPAIRLNMDPGGILKGFRILTPVHVIDKFVREAAKKPGFWQQNNQKISQKEQYLDVILYLGNRRFHSPPPIKNKSMYYFSLGTNLKKVL